MGFGGAEVGDILKSSVGGRGGGGDNTSHKKGGQF